MRRLIVGDIHGCYEEFLDLLDKAGLCEDDHIVALGDIVDRGPDSPAVLNFFRRNPNACSLMGNHERKHIRSFHGEIRPALSQIISRGQFGEDRYPEAVAYMETLMHFLELPEAILVHGFFEPNVSLPKQREAILIGTLSGEKYLKERYDRPWYELYDGDKPLVAGHIDYLGTGEPLIYKDRVFCIDTGCCRGGTLTGLVLPEFRLISVPSRRNHWAEVLKDHRPQRDLFSDDSLTWEEVQALVGNFQRHGHGCQVADDRALRLTSVLATAEKALQALLAYIVQENERVLSQLRLAYPSFDELSPREQAKFYSAWLGENPLMTFLHMARKGELTAEKLRKLLRTPKNAIEVAIRIGLLNCDDYSDN